MLNGLDLFSGIGGIALALSPWVLPIAYCEYDRKAAACILSRISDGELPNAPIWDDVRTLRGGAFVPSSIDIITGGFPCQDVSSAGLRIGLEGERSGLFREAIRLVRECKPKFVFFENVQGIRKFVHSVRGELEALGYDCRDGFLSASEVGADHQRNRWWLLAHASGERLETLEHDNKPRAPNAYHGCISPTLSQKDIDQCTRENDGVRIPVDRIKGLGNAVVPLQAREAFKILMGIK